MHKKIRKAWGHVHAYALGVAAAVVSGVYYASERAYIAPVPDDHLVWLWGLSTVVFLHHSYQMRYRISMLLLINHGFVHNIRTGPTFRRMIHNHARARKWSDVTMITSFVVCVFYYMFPTAYALPVWFGLTVTTTLLVRRASAMFDMAQTAYLPQRPEDMV